MSVSASASGVDDQCKADEHGCQWRSVKRDPERLGGYRIERLVGAGTYRASVTG